MDENPCGSCHACCDRLEVADLEPPKPFLVRCPHVQVGCGCEIYPNRPESCRVFACTWLTSQSGRGPNGEAWDRMAPELRPVRCGVIFAPIDEFEPGYRLHVHVDPKRPDAWRRRDVKRWLERIVTRGITVVLRVGHKSTVLRRDLPNMRRRPPAA